MNLSIILVFKDSEERRRMDNETFEQMKHDLSHTIDIAVTEFMKKHTTKKKNHGTTH